MDCRELRANILESNGDFSFIVSFIRERQRLLFNSKSIPTDDDDYNSVGLYNNLLVFALLNRVLFNFKRYSTVS